MRVASVVYGGFAARTAAASRNASPWEAMRASAISIGSAALAIAAFGWPIAADASSFTARLEALEVVYGVDPAPEPTRVSQSFVISPPIPNPISLSLDLSGHIDYPIFEDSMGKLVDFPTVVRLRMSGAQWEAADPGGSNAGGLFPPYSASDLRQGQSAFELALEPDGSFRYSTIFVFSGYEFPSLSLVTAGIGFEALCGNYVLLPCPPGTTPPYSFVQSGSVFISYAGITLSDSILSPDLTRALSPDPPDFDSDGIADGLDNCPDVPNPEQEDVDGNQVGDACNDSEDTDGDDWADELDNCAGDFDISQSDQDGDGLGDICDPFPNDPDNDLAQCSSDLGDCQFSLITCESDAAQCSTDLTQTQGSLTICTGDLSSCIGTATELEADLVQTETDLSEAQADNVQLQADVAQLQSDLASTESDLAQTEADLGVATADTDGDGVRDIFDLCPETSLGAEVDGFGCSLDQFCGGIDVTDKAGRGACNSSDWGNDEPGDEPEDCRARQGECVPLISG